MTRVGFVLLWLLFALDLLRRCFERAGLYPGGEYVLVVAVSCFKGLANIGRLVPIARGKVCEAVSRPNRRLIVVDSLGAEWE